MLESRDSAAKYFACSESERACFEAGIKLGAIYHQYVGTPVSAESVDSLERAIEAGVRIQPFVTNVKVRIDRSRMKPKRSTYRYTSLKGEMLDVWLQVRYGDCVATCEMKYIKDLRYTLMRVVQVSEA
jgi:hypothetical protein